MKITKLYHYLQIFSGGHRFVPLKKKLVGLALFTTILAMQAGQHQFRTLDVEKGLSDNQVHAVYRDSKGFVWVGTMSGLNRYDGKNIKIYKNDPGNPHSLPQNFVLKIIEDEEGVLWMLARNGTVFFYNREKDNFYVDAPMYHQEVTIARNYVSDIFIDNQKMVWFTNNYFGIYQYNKVTGEVKWLKQDESNPKSIYSNNISSISQDSKGYYWVIHRKGVLEQLDKEDYTVIQRVEVFDSDKIGDEESFEMFIDTDDEIWVYPETGSSGLVCYNPKLKKQKRFSVSGNPEVKIESNSVKGVIQDTEGIIWIGMDHGGIHLYNKTTGSLNTIQKQLGEANTLPDNSVYTLYSDDLGIVWLGMYKGGLAYYHQEFFKFRLFTKNPFDPKSICYSDINCFEEAKDGNIWVGTNGGGLALYNRRKKNFTCYKSDPNRKNSLSNDIVIDLYRDSKDRLWIGTYFGGLNYLKNGVFKVFKNESGNPASISDDRVWKIYEDSKGTLWVGTLGGGVNIFDPENQTFSRLVDNKTQDVGSSYIYTIMEADDGKMWFGTAYGIDVYNPQSKIFRKFSKQQNRPNSLSNNLILCMAKDQRGWHWIGTGEGLNLFIPGKEEFRIFTIKDGLPNNTIKGIQVDSAGNLWLTTANGLSNLIIENVLSRSDFDFTIRNFTTADGLQGREFNERATLMTSKGEILIGGVKGFNLFYPEQIVARAEARNVTLVGFELFNRKVKVNEQVNKRVLLTKSLLEMDELELKHNENVFSIEFTSLDYLHPDKLTYQYKMKGFNDSWLFATAKSNKATFTNLSPGKYTFSVKVSSDGEFWGQETALKITIMPPWWFSTVAKISYLLFILAILLLLRYWVLQKERMKHRIAVEQKEIENKQQLDKLKIKFITNVSHEFKTPLTLILAHSEKLLKDDSLEKYWAQIDMIGRNGKRLLKLVNQLLDFRKMEVNQLSLNLSHGDIIGFIRSCIVSFTDLSESRGISLSFSAEIKVCEAWFDHDKVEKILFNLVSNAFKFTPENGRVNVKLQMMDEPKKHGAKKTGQCLQIAVHDTGIGIDADRKEQVFERFFQEPDTGAIANQGTGIGLSLVKEFVNLHGGDVKVLSEKGTGTVFIVTIPIIKEVQGRSADEEQIDELEVDYKQEFPTADLSMAPDESLGKEKPLLLLVEDNADLRSYLRENLKGLFKVQEAENGQQAWEKVLEEMPDLIVCDVMMPVMDGIEFCKLIKNDQRTSHLPIIMLTARSTKAQKIEGLESGADDYITKPFSYEMLELKIRNRIESRRKLRARFNNSLEIEPEKISETSVDQKFFKHAVETVEKNIEDENFSVEQLSRELGISRAHLYKKLVALTGKTPAGFIRTLKMKKAAQLIILGQYTISEVAYKVGYNGTRYFSKHFKDEYDVIPSQFGRENTTSINK